jgi:uncharacterized membrane protein YebE (DUF533 family)
LKIISFGLERLTNDSAYLLFRECEHALILDEELSVKDLNYQLKDLCQRNQDGSRATQAERFQLLLKYGAVAGVGALAWKAYQNYQSNSQQTAAPSSSVEQQGQQLDQLVGVPQEQRGLQILQAMIMAARADGHIDGKERELLSQEIAKLQPDDELHAWIQQQFDAPLDPSVFARTVDCPQGKREIYLVSAAIIDDQNPMERAWLDQLASALELDPVITGELERQLLAM